jgi:NAD(P)-dependent dehydrogenase (short-subunit alcohol dehydrogenase family)
MLSQTQLRRRLDGRVAVVTGAGSGNGLAIATAYAREGAAVAIGEYSEPRGEAAEAEIVRSGGKAIFVPTDVREAEAVDRLISRTVEEFGRLDVIVNNAGVLDGYARCLDTSLELFEQVMGINVRGVFLGCKRALAEMVPMGYGKIINMASVAGLVAGGGGTTYTMTKHAVVGLTRQLAWEYGPHGVRVNAICPGPIATDLRRNSMEILGELAPEMSSAGIGALPPEKLMEIVPLGKRGTAEDIANAAIFLASAESDYMNGSTLVIDGGWSAH